MLLHFSSPVTLLIRAAATLNFEHKSLYDFARKLTHRVLGRVRVVAHSILERSATSVCAVRIESNTPSTASSNCCSRILGKFMRTVAPRCSCLSGCLSVELLEELDPEDCGFGACGGTIMNMGIPDVMADEGALDPRFLRFFDDLPERFSLPIALVRGATLRCCKGSDP